MQVVLSKMTTEGIDMASTKKPKPIKKPVKKPDDGFGDYGVKINGSPVISRTGSR